MPDVYHLPAAEAQQKFLFRPKTETPEGNRTLNCLQIDHMKAPPWRFMTYNMRMTTSLIWKVMRRIANDQGEGILKVGRKELYEMCIPQEDRVLCPMKIFTKTICMGLLYEPCKNTRKRSGGKDPITRKNKQTIVETTYLFNSPWDVIHAMESLMALWLPYFAEIEGEIGDFDNESFDRWLELIENEPDTEIMKDLLLVKDNVHRVEFDRIVESSPGPTKKATSNDKAKELQNFIRGFGESRPTAEEMRRFYLRNTPGHDKFGYEL